MPEFRIEIKCPVYLCRKVYLANTGFFAPDILFWGTHYSRFPCMNIRRAAPLFYIDFAGQAIHGFDHVVATSNKMLKLAKVPVSFPE